MCVFLGSGRRRVTIGSDGRCYHPSLMSCHHSCLVNSTNLQVKIYDLLVPAMGSKFNQPVAWEDEECSNVQVHPTDVTPPTSPPTSSRSNQCPLKRHVSFR